MHLDNRGLQRKEIRVMDFADEKLSPMGERNKTPLRISQS